MRLNDTIKEVLKDRLEAWELVEALGLSVEDVIVAFEEELEDKIETVLDYFDIQDFTEQENDD